MALALASPGLAYPGLMLCGVFKTFAALPGQKFGCRIAAWRTGILQQFTAFRSAWLTTSNADGVGNGDRDEDGDGDAGN